MRKRQRGFKQPQKKFFYKEDIFLSRMASVLKIPQSKVKELFFQKTSFSIKLINIAKEELDKKGLILKKLEWFENTYIVKDQSETVLKKMQEYKTGLLTVQNIAELIPIVALDLRWEDRFFEIDFQFLHKNISSETYDKILLRAPSSREGNISFLKKRSLKNWDIKKTKALSKLQKQIIVKAFEMLDTNGLLVYFTTTISPNENESVVSFLLEKNKNAVLKEIELVKKDNFKNYKPFVKQGLKEWNGEVFHADIKKTLRTIPGKTMIGSFTALIQKI